MTMAEVLEAVAGLGERFDRHAKRLAALERETGINDSDDPTTTTTRPRRKLRKPWPTTTIRTRIRTRIEAGPPGHPGP